MDIMNTKHAEKLNALFEELVPGVGKAETAAGEIVRAVSRVAYRYFNDGDKVGLEYGNETCNAPVRFLMEQDDKLCDIVSRVWDGEDTFNYSVGDDEYVTFLDALIKRAVELIAEKPELTTEANATAYESFFRPEDTKYDEEDEEL